MVFFPQGINHGQNGEEGEKAKDDRETKSQKPTPNSL